jgi:phenylalanyl-tRNA synthetase beta chain
MKISYDWLKRLIDTGLDEKQLAGILTHAGLEVESIEEYEEIRGSLGGLVIGEVLTCKSHPNADKLKVTTVDAGTGRALPIVCGAPNVASGQKVIVAKEGAVLYPVKGEPIGIKKAKIRGEISEGMICSDYETGLGNDQSGIRVIDTNLPNGTPLTELIPVMKDKIFEIGLTPNRADATSHLGVARDVRALTGKKVNIEPVDNFHTDDHTLPIEVSIENEIACPRYSGITIRDVKIGESPKWLINRLRSIGLEPINNVVDITNFILNELGQPLHAFDYDRITGKKVTVKTLPAGTPFSTLDGVERKLRAEDLMICDQSGGMCIAGVFGGLNSGITSNTKNVFLESAYFNPAFIRKTIIMHDLKTDAGFRFEKGTDPEITVYALKRAAMLIREIAGGKISSEVMDIYPNPVHHPRVIVKFKNINRLAGIEIPSRRIREILELLEIEIESESPDGLTVIVPPYRVDVTREADIAEEILRIYGYNNIPLSETLRTDFLANFPDNDPTTIHMKLAQLLSSRGFNEIITNSLSSPEISRGIGIFNENENVEIMNKISDELGVLRQSLLFSGLQVIAYNISHKQYSLKFFELGKTYRKIRNGFEEKNEFVLFWTGDAEEENWIRKPNPAAIHDIYGITRDILLKFNISDFGIRTFQNEIFSQALDIIIGGKEISQLGILSSSVIQKAGIRQEVLFMKMDFDLFLDIINTNITFRQVPKYPEVRRDLSLVIDKQITFMDIMKVISRAEGKLIRNVNIVDHYVGENIDPGKKAYAVSFILQDPDSTLTDKVIDKTMGRLMKSFETELQAIIRK